MQAKGNPLRIPALAETTKARLQSTNRARSPAERDDLQSGLLDIAIAGQKISGDARRRIVRVPSGFTPRRFQPAIPSVLKRMEGPTE